MNRAFPYVSSNEADDIVDVQTPVLFQLVITNLLANKNSMQYVTDGLHQYSSLPDFRSLIS